MVAKLLSTGLLAGLVVGFLGVGASTVVVPAMTFWMGIHEHEAHGTTCIVVLPTALIAAWLYAMKGHVDLNLALTLGAGGVVGAYLGTLLMGRLSPLVLRRVFATTALLAGWQMLSR